MGKSPKVNTHSHLILPLANNFLLFSVRTISRINHAPEAELKCEGPLRSIYPRRGELRKGMPSLCSRCCVQTSPSRSFPSFSPSVLLCHYYYFPWVLLPNKITQSHMIIFPWDSLIWITFLSIFLMSGTIHIFSLGILATSLRAGYCAYPRLTYGKQDHTGEATWLRSWSWKAVEWVLNSDLSPCF